MNHPYHTYLCYSVLCISKLSHFDQPHATCYKYRVQTCLQLECNHITEIHKIALFGLVSEIKDSATSYHKPFLMIKVWYYIKFMYKFIILSLNHRFVNNTGFINGIVTCRIVWGLGNTLSNCGLACLVQRCCVESGAHKLPTVAKEHHL